MTRLIVLSISRMTTAAMPIAMPVALTLALAPFLAPSLAAAQAKKQQTRGAYRSQLDAILSENNTPCKTADDCEAVGIGAKPCGGPTEFILLSKGTRSKVSSEFSDLTKIITQLDVEANAAEGTMGTCEAMKKPDLACSAGTCVKASAAPPKN